MNTSTNESTWWASEFDEVDKATADFSGGMRELIGHLNPNTLKPSVHLIRSCERRLLCLAAAFKKLADDVEGVSR